MFFFLIKYQSYPQRISLASLQNPNVHKADSLFVLDSPIDCVQNVHPPTLARRPRCIGHFLSLFRFNHALANSGFLFPSRMLGPAVTPLWVFYYRPPPPLPLFFFRFLVIFNSGLQYRMSPPPHSHSIPVPPCLTFHLTLFFLTFEPSLRFSSVTSSSGCARGTPFSYHPQP